MPDFLLHSLFHLCLFQSKKEKLLPLRKRLIPQSVIPNLLLLFVLSVGAMAQPAIQWDKTLGDNAEQRLVVVKQTSDGGYIAAGLLFLAPNGDGVSVLDYQVVKVSASGTQEWIKSYGGNRNDQLVEIFQAADGGYLLAGHSKSDASGNKSANDKGINATSRGDYWIIKIKANGDVEWDKTIGGTGEDVLWDAKQTPDGGYILAGFSNSGVGADKSQPLTAGGLYNHWIVKIRANGSIEWEKTIGDTGAEVYSLIDLTMDGGYILGGSTGVPPSGFPDTYVAKLSSNGTVEWSKLLGIDQSELRDIHQTREGDYILAIKAETIRPGIPYLVMKLDDTGSEIWRRIFAGALPINDSAPYTTDQVSSVVQTPDGGFLVGGRSDSPASEDKSENSKGGDDYWIIKMDADGNKQWDKTIGGIANDALSSIEVTSDGGFLLGGYSESPISNDKSEAQIGPADLWVIKLAAEPNTRLLSFSSSNLGVSVITDTTIISQPVTLIASTGTPPVTLTKTDNSPWLILPSTAAAGPLTFSINTAGLAIGSYSATVTAASAGYASAPLNVQLTVTSSVIIPDLSTIRINAGGERIITSDERVFEADRYYAGTDRINTIASGGIRYTAEDVLYRSERSAPSFSYNIPVVNGEYVVVLHFAEIWFGLPGGRPSGPGKRLFNVDAEGSRVLSNYDIFTKSQGPLTAVEEELNLTVSDGVLNLDFSSGAANLPTIAAIEVIPGSQYSSSTQTKTVIADAYGEQSLENFGALPFITVKAGEGSNVRTAYLKFPLNGIGEVSSAKLRVYGRNLENQTPVNLSVYSSENDSWNELRVNSYSPPARSSLPLGSTNVDEVEKYYELDVTEFVKAQAEGDYIATLVLENPTGKNLRLDFHSRENPSGNAPQLVIKSRNVEISNMRTGELTREEKIISKAEIKTSSVYPNPVKKQFTVNLSPRHDGPVSLQLTNKSGRSFPVQSMENGSSSLQKKVDLSGLSLEKGIYLLKVSSKSLTEVLKVLVAE